jgi:polyhydroxyalkanoate synthase
MRTTFNMLRANDLIWTFVVNNYLMGKDPYPFDLLYWNSDSTRMPRALHMFYLREMYQKNSLVQPGGISINGVPIDLSKIEIPVYLQSAQDDHIAPYRSVFKAVQHYSGPVRFMLAGSGHIAGVINPPEAGKYWHKTNDANPRDLEEWLAGATQEPGSWWPDWQRWAEDKVGPRVPARQPGSGGLEVIEDAPGSYVKA